MKWLKPMSSSFETLQLNIQDIGITKDYFYSRGSSSGIYFRKEQVWGALSDAVKSPLESECKRWSSEKQSSQKTSFKNKILKRKVYLVRLTGREKSFDQYQYISISLFLMS